MKKIIKLTLIAFLALGTVSCVDFLDVVPEGDATIYNAFSNRGNAERFLFTVYSYLPRFGDISAPNFFVGDEHWTLPPGVGQIQASMNNFAAGNGMDAWNISRGYQETSAPLLNFWDGGVPGGVAARSGIGLWRGIRDAHIFLENIHRPQDLDPAERYRWMAEVRFLKAYYHFFLLKLYGPIPIMREMIEVGAPVEDVRVFRDPVDEVVEFIVETLDSAMEWLPLTIINPAAEMGRITRPIAAAVRAQVLMFAASPLMNGNPEFADIVDSRGVHLFPRTFDPAKWVRAAEAAREAIDIAHEAGHRLFTFADPLHISETTRTIMSINGAVTERWNDEIIWGETRAHFAGGRHAIQAFAAGRPIGLGQILALTAGTASLLAVTLDVAEQFHSSNGVPIEEDNSYFWANNFANRHSVTTIPDEGINRHILDVGQRTAYLHLNRELRFYSNLTFNTSRRYAIGMPNDDAALWRFNLLGGTHGGDIGGGYYSITGYLNNAVFSFRNGLSPAPNSLLSVVRYAFPIIRLADLYLMYAEALNETLSAPTGTVHHYVDLVRERAGLDGVVVSWAQHSRYPNRPLTQEGMREIIRRERLIELSGEGGRFWDMRRWRIHRSEEVRGWNVHGRTPEEFYQVTVLFHRPRQTVRDFLWPISTHAIIRNPNLMQNPGW